ncbi:reverse transcriptase domain-containing protein [Tanacetum coccineum]
MPNNVKTYDGTSDPEDHLKIFQAATQVERWAMPTWCHMFNSTLIRVAGVWFDELPPESIDGYNDLKAAFLAYFMQQKKYVKDPVEIYNIKQRDGETIEEFMERFKIETGRMRGAPECMRIFGFMHGVNNPELIKRLNEHVPKTLEEMMTTTAAFIRGEITAASKKKVHTTWKSQDQSKRHTSVPRPDFRSQPKPKDGRGSSKFTPLTRTPKNNFAAESGKFKPPPPMVTLVEKRSSNKFCEFHNDKGHNTDECVQLKKQIEELPWQRVTRQKVTQSFDRVREITFPPLTVSKGTEGPLLIEAEIGGHAVHYMRRRAPMKAWMNFMIVRSPSLYNGIIGRPGIREIQAVPSTAHRMIKFSANGGIVTIRSTILTPTECAAIAATPKDTENKAKTRHRNFKVAIHPDFLDQEIAIGGALSAKGRTELCALLKANLDIFAWQPSDMTGVPRSIAEHRLNIRDGYPPVRQKKRSQAPERAKAIQAEVQKLVEAGIMREVYYHDWLSNPVMVKKHDGSWRMCVDFTDLNKACPQDCYPLPEIDWKVESLCGYPFKCFLDAYKGYHQIQMAEADEEKTAFHTPQGVYCYTKMPFGLKNAGATYQRLVDKAFDKQVGRNLEVGRDVPRVHDRPGRNKTMPRQGRRCATTSIPTNNQGGPEPQWEVGRPKQTSEAEQDFKHLKQHISELPMLVAPRPKDELIIYLSASHGVVGAVLMTERDTIQMVSLLLITDQPIKQIISRPDVAGQLQKWSVMLGEHNITYRPRTSVKGQILADFLVEKPEEVPANTSVKEVPQESWTLFTDEYEALIVGLRIEAQMGVRNVQVSVDSKLVANQVLGTYIAKEDNMIKYHEKTKSLVGGFDSFSISQVTRSKNKKADALSKITSTSFAHLSKQVPVKILKEKSIQEKEVAAVVEEEGPTWMTPILNYWKDGTLPDDPKKASKLRIKAR